VAGVLVSARTPGGLVLLGGNGHASASQRRETILQAEVASAAAAAAHYLTLIAVLVIQQGGKALIPPDALTKTYDIGFGKDAETGALIYTAEPHIEPPAKPLIVAPSEAPS
jgi:hypothetical protein